MRDPFPAGGTHARTGHPALRAAPAPGRRYDSTETVGHICPFLPCEAALVNLSTRNRIPGTVSGVATGGVMAVVTVRLGGGRELTAAVTRESVEELGLTEGSAVQALVKATEVALATGSVDGLSIRNRLPGTVTAISPGAVMTSVKVAVEGITLTAVVTGDAVADLGIAVGSPVTALIKSTEVSLASVR